VSTVIARPGILIVDASFRVVASNKDAIQILTFPEGRDKLTHLNGQLSVHLRSCLIPRDAPARAILTELRSAKRIYRCRSFPLSLVRPDTQGEPQPAMVIVLERKSNGHVAAAEIARRFGLSQREQQVVQWLEDGLTSKEIGVRMKISANTVKGYIRLIMVKMDVNTRSGILGKILGTKS
jgi:DNA-binding CsgD family transcriptional regulator